MCASKFRETCYHYYSLLIFIFIFIWRATDSRSSSVFLPNKMNKTIISEEEKFLAVSELVCTQHCSKDVNCKSYSFVPENKQCRIHHKLLFEAEIENDVQTNESVQHFEKKLCPLGWLYHRFSDKCFKLITEKLTLSQGLEKCKLETKGGQLAKVETQDEHDFVKTHYLSSDQSELYYIGLTDTISEDTFTWLDGSTTTFWQTEVNGFSSSVEKNCVVYKYSSGWTLKNLHCGMMHHILCERSTSGASTMSNSVVQSLTDQTCGNDFCYCSGWQLLSNTSEDSRCVKKFSDPQKYYNDANDACAKYDGHLVTIKNQAENDIVHSMINPSHSNSHIIGLRRNSAKQWTTWKDGSAIDFVKWKSSSEGNPTFNNCAGIKEDGIISYKFFASFVLCNHFDFWLVLISET